MMRRTGLVLMCVIVSGCLSTPSNSPVEETSGDGKPVSPEEPLTATSASEAVGDSSASDSGPSSDIKEDRTADSGKPGAPKEEEVIFRCPSGANTMYFIFRENGTYSLVAREHMFTMEVDHGCWEQETDGLMVLTSSSELNARVEEKEGAVYHIRPVSYRSQIILTSSDHGLISIFAADKAEAMKRFDESGSDDAPHHLFTLASRKKASAEMLTPQSFLFFQGMNKPRSHPVIQESGNIKVKER